MGECSPLPNNRFNIRIFILRRRGQAGENLVYKHHDVFILGQLEADGYEPVLNVSVMPWSTKNLAPSVWHQLYLQTVREREAQPYLDSAAAERAADAAVAVTALAVTLLAGL